ncbi:hypothetical protein EV385_5789 [Krasilnikovia cinnamomea]|uniref:Uncharacterized protein n=1 Tax=Krasilnikovia cinnamomea TaxID=349313 RepID=A0A4Q7ZTJ7_9ACTN|nr:hypothetical protein EV385_5789 [Krasilnikovia cinnamomea]
MVAAAVVAGCGLGSKKESSSEPPRSSLGEASPAQPAKQTLTVGKTVWYLGFKWTFETLTFDPQEDGAQLTGEVLAENLSKRDYTPDVGLMLSVGGHQYEGYFEDATLVGGLQKSRQKVAFRLDGNTFAGDFGSGEILVGNANNTQARVPLGSAGTLVANEPRMVLAGSHEVRIHEMSVWLKNCELRPDVVPSHEQAKKGYTMLACGVDLQRHLDGGNGYGFGSGNLRLKMPDGTTVGPTDYPSEALYTSAIVPDGYVSFMIPDTTKGRAAVQVVIPEVFKAAKPGDTKDVPVTL